MRRCRPLLGTFVEITACGLDESRLNDAVGAAFAVVEKLQRLLSAYDERSELSRVNREAASRPVAVGAETYEVLRRAIQMAEESKGAFDPTVAPLLARWGLLPAHLRRKSPGDWRDVELLPRTRVFFHRPLALDLGGIAKGFAVDAAIETLKASEVEAALVNAGGDLRTFGSRPSTIHLRHPLSPDVFTHTLDLAEGALATSSPCFTEGAWRGRRMSHLVNPPEKVAVTGGVSVSVRAPECWLADALTKVVLNAPKRAEKLLAKHGAEAFVLTA